MAFVYFKQELTHAVRALKLNGKKNMSIATSGSPTNMPSYDWPESKPYYDRQYDNAQLWRTAEKINAYAATTDETIASCLQKAQDELKKIGSCNVYMPATSGRGFTIHSVGYPGQKPTSFALLNSKNRFPETVVGKGAYKVAKTAFDFSTGERMIAKVMYLRDLPVSEQNLAKSASFVIAKKEIDVEERVRGTKVLYQTYVGKNSRAAAEEQIKQPLVWKMVLFDTPFQQTALDRYNEFRGQLDASNHLSEEERGILVDKFFDEMTQLLQSIVKDTALVHEKGVIHNDIALKNIDFNHGTLIDWGLSLTPVKTESGWDFGNSSWGGTYSTAAPLLNKGWYEKVTPESAQDIALQELYQRDVFSIGATFYEVFFNKPFYAGEDKERDHRLEAERLLGKEGEAYFQSKFADAPSGVKPPQKIVEVLKAMLAPCANKRATLSQIIERLDKPAV